MTELVAPPEWFSSSRSRTEELFADIVETATTGTMDGYGALLVGEPYDRSIVSNRGTEQGPSALREALATTPIPPGAPGATRSVADIGTIGIPARQDDSSVQETIRSFTGRVHDTDTVPVFLGGDSSLTFPNVVPAIESGTVGIVRFDSYPALDGAPKSGTSYRRLFENGLDSLAVLGARNVGPTLSTGNYPYERRSHIATLGVVESGPIDAVDGALDALSGVDAVYVSVNLNVLSAAAASGVKAQTPQGISATELGTMLRHVATHSHVAGLEILGCAPLLESGNQTAHAGARGIAQFLAGVGETP